MYKIIFTLCFLGIVINNVTSQFTLGSVLPNQITSVPIPKQQLLNYLLSNFNQPLGEKIEVLASAVKQMPPRRNRRIYLADVLKQSAFQNLLVAASVCGQTAALPQRIPDYAVQSYASYVPQRNFVGGDDVVVANKDLLSALLPRELVSSLVGDAPNRALRMPFSTY